MPVTSKSSEEITRKRFPNRKRGEVKLTLGQSRKEPSPAKKHKPTNGGNK